MPRNAEDARERLRHAALELFAEKGFDQTTAAEIAARAGVTERTFFRHFPDKKEVLFDGQAILSSTLTDSIASAPARMPAMEILRRAFGSVTEMLEARRAYSGPRARIIAATPALQEREIAKSAAIAEAVSAALQKRGIARPMADLAAQTGGAVLNHALGAWFADPSSPLANHLDAAFSQLQALAHG